MGCTRSNASRELCRSSHAAVARCLIPGGALAVDASRWIRSSAKFLFRVERLAEVFRSKFLEGLKSRHAKGERLFPGKTAPLATPERFFSLLNTLSAKDLFITHISHRGVRDRRTRTR